MEINLGKALKNARMTQAAVADGVGVSRGYISDIVSGKKTPSIEMLGQIADYIGMDVRDVYAQSDDIQPTGMAETAAAPLRLPKESATVRAAKLIAPRVRKLEIFEAKSASAFLSIAKGDRLIVDIGTKARDGDTVIATTASPNGATISTAIYMFLDPWVVSGMPNETPLNIGAIETSVGILGVIKGVMRET